MSDADRVREFMTVDPDVSEPGGPDLLTVGPSLELAHAIDAFACVRIQAASSMVQVSGIDDDHALVG
jgi:hypothetical protein